MKLLDKLNDIIKANQDKIKIINHTDYNSGQYTSDNSKIKYLFFCELCNKPLYQIKHNNGLETMSSWKDWAAFNSDIPDINNIYPADAYIYIRQQVNN